jgi:hypothetical protein
MNARSPLARCCSSPAELLQLAYCAWNAGLELTSMAVRRPRISQMGLSNEPHIYRPSNTTALLIGESPTRIVIAAATKPPSRVHKLEDLAGTFVEANAEGVVPAPFAAPGMVTRHDLTLAQLLWEAAESHVAGTTRELVLTGHGQAAAAVTLAALGARFARPRCRISVVTFGSPPIGDREFCGYYNQTLPRHLRIESDDDIVPHLGEDPLLLSLIWPDQAAQMRAAHTALSHVGRLQYFHDGCAVANCSESNLCRSRRFRLFSLLCSGERETAVRDHSLEAGYLQVLTVAGRPHPGGRSIEMGSCSTTVSSGSGVSRNERWR